MFFLDCFYFMIVTSSTIGYGDISPFSVPTRLAVLLIVLTLFAIFAENISKLAAIIRETNVNDRKYNFS